MEAEWSRPGLVGEWEYALRPVPRPGTRAGLQRAQSKERQRGKKKAKWKGGLLDEVQLDEAGAVVTPHYDLVYTRDPCGWQRMTAEDDRAALA